MSRYITTSIFSLLLLTIGYGQRDVGDIRFEYDLGVIGTHNLNNLEDGVPRCCFFHTFESESPLVTLIQNIGIDYQYAKNSAVNVSLGYMKTGRAISVFTSGDFPQPVEFMDDIATVASTFLSLSHIEVFQINEKLDIIVQNGFAVHHASSSFDQRYIYPKSLFFNYLLKAGPALYFHKVWSFSPRITSQVGLSAQDEGKGYRPLSVGLELSFGYKI